MNINADLIEEKITERSERIPSSDSYCRKGYQEIYTRNPNIEKAEELFGWTPKIGLEESLKNTLDAFLKENEDLVGVNK